MKKISYISAMQKCLLFFVVINLLTALAFYFIKEGADLKKELSGLPMLLLFYFILGFYKKQNLGKAEFTKRSSKQRLI